MPNIWQKGALKPGRDVTTRHLTRSEEISLATRWREDGDERALARLIDAYRDFAHKVARKFIGFGLDHEDLFQQACLGMVEAASRFDPDRGNRFSTYAIWWMRANLMDYVQGNMTTISLGGRPGVRRFCFNYRKLREPGEASRHRGNAETASNGLARACQLSEADAELLEAVLTRKILSLDSPRNTVSDGSPSLHDTLPSEARTPEEYVVEEREVSARRNWLRNAVCGLSAREREIIEQRWFAERSVPLRVLGERFQISTERVRVIEKRAIEKLSVLAATQLS